MNKKPPRITVAMITYNHEAFIVEAVASILGQTYSDFELLIVNDGSTDGTEELIRSFRDDRINLINQENRGPSAARNTALQAARGSIIAQMSGDDVAEQSRLERQIACHDEQPDSVIFSRCTFIDDSGNPMEGGWFDACLNRPNWSREETLHHLFFRGNSFLAPSALAAKNIFMGVGFYKPQLLQLQDYDMWIRALVKGHATYICQEPLLRYRIRGNNANLSAPSPATKTRTHFERRRILREYLALKDIGHFLEIFPEAKELGYPLDENVIPFLLAMIALHGESRDLTLQHFGAELLIDLMEDPLTRDVLKNKAGFSEPDLFSILGRIDPIGGMQEFYNKRLNSLEAQLHDLLNSRTWRMTLPLRACTNWLKKLSPGDS